MYYFGLSELSASLTCLTFDQSVFVRWRRSCEDSQLWPDLINAFLFNLWTKTECGNTRIHLRHVQFKPLNVKQGCVCSAPGRTSPSSLRMRRLNSRPSMHRKSSPGCMMPHLVAMARAVLMLSPVTIRTVIPARWHFLMASGTCWENGWTESRDHSGDGSGSRSFCDYCSTVEMLKGRIGK